MKRVNTFVDYNTELVEESFKKAKAKVKKGSSKRAGTDLEQESSKKQKIDDDKETAKLKHLVKIIPDEEEVANNVIPLAVKPSSIVDWKIHKEGKKRNLMILEKNIKFKGGLIGLKVILMMWITTGGTRVKTASESYYCQYREVTTAQVKMVNTRTDADLSGAVQNALQALLPQIRVTAPVDVENWISHMEKIFDVMGCEDAFKTRLAEYKFEGNALAWWKAYKQAKGGDAWLITQKPHSFEKAIVPVDAKNWISHMEKIFDVMGCQDAFKTRLAVYKFEGNALAWWKAYKQAKGGDAWLVTEYHSIRQTSIETSTEFMQCFLRLAGFLGAAAGTEEEQAKNFQWGLRRSTLNNLMGMSYTDVAQVDNTARNYEILHERDDKDTERPDKRGVVIGINRPLNRVVTGATVIITTVMDLTGESRGPSEGYSYPACTTCGRRHQRECRRAVDSVSCVHHVIVFQREVAEDSQNMQDYHRLSSKLREALDDMEKASRLLLMAKEIQTKGLQDAMYAFQHV
nr:hypothetical protein [Tanacetum cinerariifolium]